MWTVNSESGRMHAVLIQDSVESFWERRLPFEGIEANLQHLPRCVHPQADGGHEQWLQLPKMLREEGIQVFEVTGIIEKALETATVKERREIVGDDLGRLPQSP